MTQRLKLIDAFNEAHANTNFAIGFLEFSGPRAMSLKQTRSLLRHLKEGADRASLRFQEAMKEET